MGQSYGPTLLSPEKLPDVCRRELITRSTGWPFFSKRGFFLPAISVEPQKLGTDHIFDTASWLTKMWSVPVRPVRRLGAQSSARAPYRGHRRADATVHPAAAAVQFAGTSLALALFECGADPPLIRVAAEFHVVKTHTSLSVMLVDDQPARAALLEQALRDHQYTVIARLSSAEGLAEQVARLSPDVIIIDIESPVSARTSSTA